MTSRAGVFAGCAVGPAGGPIDMAPTAPSRGGYPSLPGSSPERGGPLPIPKIHTVPASRAGERLDRFLAEAERSLSRSAVRQLIDDGHVRLNDAPARPSRRGREGDRIEAVRPRRAPQALLPEAIQLDVGYGDDALAVTAHPAGRGRHPGRGHAS